MDANDFANLIIVLAVSSPAVFVLVIVLLYLLWREKREHKYTEKQLRARSFRNIDTPPPPPLSLEYAPPPNPSPYSPSFFYIRTETTVASKAKELAEEEIVSEYCTYCGQGREKKDKRRCDHCGAPWTPHRWKAQRKPQ